MKNSVELLKECDAGLDMAVDSFDQVIDEAKADNFTNMLHKYYDDHKNLKLKVDQKLAEFGASPKNANPLGKTSSKLMSNMKIMMDGTDKKIADLMIDGCNMGIKSVSRYMNEYSDATQDISQLANDIVVLEQNFMNELRQYL